MGGRPDRGGGKISPATEVTTNDARKSSEVGWGVSVSKRKLAHDVIAVVSEERLSTPSQLRGISKVEWMLPSASRSVIVVPGSHTASSRFQKRSIGESRPARVCRLTPPLLCNTKLGKV
jgi:hypothetical protein